MPKTQITCPQCRQPIAADVEQLFDVSADPNAKKRFLSGQVNVANCPHCGFQGPLATPIVYHDADKELLLTYFPPELGLPANEQERLIGPLINRVVNRLPMEKRKAYLLQPRNFLTLQSMIEHILQADGISPETVRRQQERVALIERLLSIQSADVRREVILQNDAQLDEEFFALLAQLFQNALASNQEGLARALNALQAELLQHSAYGKQLQGQMQEIEAAAQTLQQAGANLTREKLLQIVREAPSDERLQALVSLARPGFDYIFFQKLSAMIETAQGDERTQLETLREKLLRYTTELDAQLEAEVQQSREFLEKLLAEEDVAAATRANLQAFNELTIQALNVLIQEAAEKQDRARAEKLEKMIAVLREASTPPVEYVLLEKLLAAPADQLDRVLTENEHTINDTFLSLLANVLGQMEQQQDDPETAAMLPKLQQAYQLAVGLMMKRNLKK